MELSLAAELLWLAVDPRGGGLLPSRRRRRLRKALAAAHRVDQPDARGVAQGWRAGRSARRDLVAAGLVEPSLRLRKLRLVDRRSPGRRFRALWESIEADELAGERDHQLAVLLASSGVLAQRLATSYEREIAWRRLKGVLSSDASAAWVAPLTGAAEMTEGIAALGAVALRGGEELLGDALNDLGDSAFGGHHDGGHHDGDGWN
jgi:hypothetical protein